MSKQRRYYWAIENLQTEDVFITEVPYGFPTTVENAMRAAIKASEEWAPGSPYFLYVSSKPLTYDNYRQCKRRWTLRVGGSRRDA